jgi:hypothetical protein
MKETAFEHKKVLKSTGIQNKGEYSLTYITSPGKSAIIQPHKGEINYKLADKNPDKFYSEVFNADVTKHTVV